VAESEIGRNERLSSQSSGAKSLRHDDAGVEVQGQWYARLGKCGVWRLEAVRRMARVGRAGANRRIAENRSTCHGMRAISPSAKRVERNLTSDVTANRIAVGAGGQS
jgi:hypothetical protein